MLAIITKSFNRKWNYILHNSARRYERLKAKEQEFEEYKPRKQKK